MAAGSLLFVLNLDMRGVLAQVRVNDITVYTNSGTQATYAEKINPLIVPGANSVTVTLSLPPPPEDPKAPPPDAPEFRMTIQRGQLGTDPGDAGVVLRYQWSQSEQPLTLIPVEALRRGFDAGPVPWHQRWPTLAPVQTSNAELNSFVSRFADALRKRDIDAVVALHGPKFRELAETLDLDQAQMATALRTQLRRMMNDANWTVAPVDMGKLQYVQEAGGRMVRITTENGDPPIMTRGGGREMPFSLTIARIDRELWIIR